MSALIGIDLGGTKTEVAVLGEDGQFLFRQRLPTRIFVAAAHGMNDLQS